MSEHAKYKLGVALSGGGARGFAHVGALMAIEEAGLKPDIIAGVSAGSVVAVLYASGMPLDEMSNIFDKKGFSDFDNGCPVEFHTGPIGERMAASCSIPIIFKPIRIDGVNYVDGGVLRNHPAWIIRDKCETLIGINVSPIRHPGKKLSLIDVALRTYNLMAKSNQAVDMAMCDLSVQPPELSGYKVFDLKNIKAVITSGYIHTRRALKDAGLWKTNP